MSIYPCPYIHVHMSITDKYKDMDKRTYGHGLGKWTKHLKLLCTTAVMIVAWIKNYLEPVWNRGQGVGRGRLKGGMALRLVGAGAAVGIQQRLGKHNQGL
jgi:hypothetical protein